MRTTQNLEITGVPTSTTSEDSARKEPEDVFFTDGSGYFFTAPAAPTITPTAPSQNQPSQHQRGTTPANPAPSPPPQPEGVSRRSNYRLAIVLVTIVLFLAGLSNLLNRTDSEIAPIPIAEQPTSMPVAPATPVPTETPIAPAAMPVNLSSEPNPTLYSRNQALIDALTETIELQNAIDSARTGHISLNYPTQVDQLREVNRQIQQQLALVSSNQTWGADAKSVETARSVAGDGKAALLSLLQSWVDDGTITDLELRQWADKDLRVASLLNEYLNDRRPKVVSAAALNGAMHKLATLGAMVYAQSKEEQMRIRALEQQQRQRAAAQFTQNQERQVLPMQQPGRSPSGAVPGDPSGGQPESNLSSFYQQRQRN